MFNLSDFVRGLEMSYPTVVETICSKNFVRIDFKYDSIVLRSEL